MPFNIKIGLKLSGIFALIAIGAGIAAFGSYAHNDDVKQVGYYVIGIGFFVIIVFSVLSFLHKKNYFG